MRQAPRSRLAHTATGGKSGAERCSSQVPLFIDHRRPNGRSVRLFFVSRTNKFAVCKTSSPAESACGPHANGQRPQGSGTGFAPDDSMAMMADLTVLAGPAGYHAAMRPAVQRPLRGPDG